MQTRSDPQYAPLIALFEKAQGHDPDARQDLKDQFDAWAGAMWEGREARRQLGLLAYLVSVKQAEKKLGRGGKFDDLRNDPESVAARQWEKFQNFSDEIDAGVEKTVDDFIARVNVLTKCVLLDMVSEKRLRARDGVAIEAGIEPVAGPPPTDDPARSREDYLDALRRARQVLPCKLFLLVTLHLVCGKPKTEIAEIMGTTTHYVNRELNRAKRLLDHPEADNADRGWDLSLA